jgi:hypothetical protein|tara:strand:+ start:711 stop:1094 length:384 start_codon:yes stop_codon:yes gene_type:complete
MMTELKEEKILNVDEKKLSTRISFLRDKLLEASKALRSQVPDDLSDADLIQDGAFKQWIICNTVYDSSLKDVKNEDFNRMLYYMFEKGGGHLVSKLLNQYDIRVEMNDAGQLHNIELIVLETETSDE